MTTETKDKIIGAAAGALLVLGLVAAAGNGIRARRCERLGGIMVAAPAYGPRYCIDADVWRAAQTVAPKGWK